jgi:hypothetical protein
VQHQADRSQAPGGLSAWPRRTVRGLQRTVRKQLPNHKYCTLNNGPSAKHSWTVRASRTVRPPRADRPTNTSRPKTPNKMDQNMDPREHANNTTNTRSADSSRTICDPLADCLPRVDRTARPRTRKHPTTYPSMDLPNGLSS